MYMCAKVHADNMTIDDYERGEWEEVGNFYIDDTCRHFGTIEVDEACVAVVVVLWTVDDTDYWSTK